MSVQTNPVIGVIGLLIIAVFALPLYHGDTSVVRPRVVASANANDAGQFLNSKPIEMRKKLYKITKGVAEFCRNTDRVRDTVVLRDMIEEVILMYDAQNETDFQLFINQAIEDAGIKKDASLLEEKAKTVEVFDKLAESIKGSIERYEEVK